MATSTPPSAIADYPQEPSSPTVTSSLLVPGDSTEAPFQVPHPSSLELPLGLPLTHQVFRDPGFDADQFLLSRRHTALDDLRAELRTYLSGLKSELVGLINEDYEDFIGLGMGLRGTVERAMGKMKAPIGQAKQDVLEARAELEVERQDLQDLLNERRKVMEGKKLVRLMLDCGDTVAKVEEMLSIQQPSIPNSNSSQLNNSINHQIIPTNPHRSVSKNGSKTELSLDLTSEDTNNLESGVNRIERITSEYSRMLYLVSKGRGLNYVDGLQPRIDQITETLYRELASLLKLILRTPRSDQRKKDCLLDCLRAYETLGAVTRAEEVIKTELVLPRMSKLIHPDALNTGTLSPVLPASPEVTRHNLSHHLTNTFGNMSNSSKLAEDLEQVPLPMLYNKILAFIAREMSSIVDIADRHLAGSKLALVETQSQDKSFSISNEGIHNEKMATQPLTYNVLVNSVILPILQLIVDSLGSNLFAAGNPITFHRNYSYTIKFLDQLEGFCGSPRQVLSLRSRSEWKSFKNKWQLAVYAQIRTKELILNIEDGLRDGIKAPSTLDPSPSNLTQQPLKSHSKVDRYLMKGSATLDQVLFSIWQDDVFLTDLTHRFWRLTLMAISRYATWLNAITASYNLGDSGTMTGATNSNHTNRTSTTDLNRLGVTTSTNRSNLSRPSTPSNSNKNLSEEAKDEEILRFFTIILSDISRLQDSILELFSTSIAPRIPKVSIGSDSLSPQDVLDLSIEKVTRYVPILMGEIRRILVKRSSEKLRFIRSVGSSARASKTIPTEPSYFISDILNDIKVYLEKYGTKYLVDHERLRSDLITSIVDELSGKYLAILINVQRSEDSLRKLKKGKQGFSIFGSNNINHHNSNQSHLNQLDHQNPNRDSNSHNVEDGDLKVKVQLRLDVQRLELDSISLGANLSNSKSFLELKQTVSK